MSEKLHLALGWAMPMAENPIGPDNELICISAEEHAAWIAGKAVHAATDEARAELEYLAALLAPTEDVQLADCIVHLPDLEGGTLLVLPPYYARSWHRVSDDLDIAFNGDMAGNAELIPLPSNPFGYSGRWMDSGTGRELSHHAEIFKSSRHDPQSERAARLIRLQAGGEVLYTGAAEAEAAVVPLVPPEIRFLAWHLELFSDLSRVLGLRPVRARWWD